MTRVGLFGIAGVGKTTLAVKVCAANPAVMHLKASELIKNEVGDVSVETLRTAPADKILQNQTLLLTAYERSAANAGVRPILFDGHCVINNDRELVPIPVTVIAQLKLTDLVFLQAPENIIREQCIADTRRTRPVLSAEEIRSQIELELSILNSYSRDLHLPLHVLNGQDVRTKSVLMTILGGFPSV